MGNRWIIIADEVDQVLNVGGFPSIVGPENKGHPNVLPQADGINHILLVLNETAFLKLLAWRVLGGRTFLVGISNALGWRL